jgi:hypothetical protein
MDLVPLIERYRARFNARHGHQTSADQWSALNAITGCRTPQYGEMVLACGACEFEQRQHHSCGHRFCHRCQNHDTTRWLERQQQKLLPVDYFMATFTLPYQLRALAKAHPKTVYAAMFHCIASTLKSFGHNARQLGADVGMTAVLHTHSRRLEYHPHIHVVIPGGGIDQKRRQWRKLKGQYLFNAFQLACVFRARLLARLKEQGLSLPNRLPRKWVVHCERVGSGLPALKYLSRYLYRGVISEKNILQDDGHRVTFQYTDSETGQLKTRSMPGEDFIHLLMQHVLPKGFRRARDYGFLHGNAKRLLHTVQWVLGVIIDRPKEKERPRFHCQRCDHLMAVIAFRKPVRGSG